MPQLQAKPQANFHVEYRAGRLSVHAVDASLRRVLAEVVRQSGIQIIGMENVRGRVSVDFSDEPLGPALTSLLIEVDYAISGDLARPQGIAHATLLVMERHGAPAGKGPAPAATTATAAKPDDGTADADADPDAEAPDPDADANADPDAPDPDSDANAEEDPNAAKENPPPAQPPAGPPVYINQPGQIAQPVPGNNPGQPGQVRPLPPGRVPPSGPAPPNPPGSMSFNLATGNVQTLAVAIQSPNAAVQGPAFTNLSAIDSGAAVRAAVAAAKNPDATVRLGALELLDNSPTAAEATVVQALGEALTDKDEQVKDYALDALVRRGQAAAGYLAPLLKDSDAALRLRVVQDLAGKDWATPLLRMALNDSDASVRVAASALVQPAAPAAQ